MSKRTWQIILKQLKFIGIYLITNMVLYLKSSPEGQSNVFSFQSIPEGQTNVYFLPSGLDPKLKTLLFLLGLDFKLKTFVWPAGFDSKLKALVCLLLVILRKLGNSMQNWHDKLY
jgi:hypothetical protein